MKRVLVIGIGAGDPDHVTMQAVKALNQADVFFILDKGAAKEKLAAVRREICDRFIEGRRYRFVTAAMPERGGGEDYLSDVSDLNREKALLFERLIGQELGDTECGAFLVWGDPTLYDSTIRILRSLRARDGDAFEFEVIPGISSIQALAAKHRIALTQIGQAFEVTTGRRLAEGFPAGVDTAVVMLDGAHAFKGLAGDDIEIFWGAYVGMKEEILVAGKLDQVADEIERLRTAAREANGWVMDSYILRRGQGAS